MVPPWQSCATVVLALWRDTTEVPAPLYGRAGLAVVVPPGHYSRDHGGDCTWRSTASRGTLCRGDVLSAVLTALSRHCRGASSSAVHHRGAAVTIVRRWGASSSAVHHCGAATAIGQQRGTGSGAVHHHVAAVTVAGRRDARSAVMHHRQAVF